MRHALPHIPFRENNLICAELCKHAAMEFIIRLGNLSWQVHTLRSALTILFTGGLIPFAALPWGLGEWLALSPLGTLAGAPLSLYTGLAAPMEVLPVQVFWNLVLWPLSLWWLNASRERLVSFGG